MSAMGRKETFAHHPSVRKLADENLEAQVKEIAEMKMLVSDLRANGVQGDGHILPARAANLTPRLKAEAVAAIRRAKFRFGSEAELQGGYSSHARLFILNFVGPCGLAGEECLSEAATPPEHVFSLDIVEHRPPPRDPLLAAHGQRGADGVSHLLGAVGVH